MSRLVWNRDGTAWNADGEHTSYRVWRTFSTQPVYIAEYWTEQGWRELPGSPYPKLGSAHFAAESFEQRLAAASR